MALWGWVLNNEDAIESYVEAKQLTDNLPPGAIDLRALDSLYPPYIQKILAESTGETTKSEPALPINHGPMPPISDPLSGYYYHETCSTDTSTQECVFYPQDLTNLKQQSGIEVLKQIGGVGLMIVGAFATAVGGACAFAGLLTTEVGVGVPLMIAGGSGVWFGLNIFDIGLGIATNGERTINTGQWLQWPF
jgi:hypothetical protein